MHLKYLHSYLQRLNEGQCQLDSKQYSRLCSSIMAKPYLTNKNDVLKQMTSHHVNLVFFTLSFIHRLKTNQSPIFYSILLENSTILLTT